MAEMQDSSGRKRTPNFTEAEKMLLVELVSEYKDILENKQTNSETISLKNECWEKVTEKFNASGYSHRTLKTIRNCWENIKKRTKKHFAEQKKELYKTGGGQSQFADNIMFNKTRDIIQPSVDGLTNIYDSDSFATIQSEQPCDTFASTDNTEDNVEYLEEYEDYVLKNKENEAGYSNVIQSNSSTTDNEINYEDLRLVEIPECSTKEKKRKITETKNMDKKRSCFISVRQKVSKESSKKKIEEFTNLARSKTALSEKLLIHEERHAIEMLIAEQRLAKEKIELEIKKTELEMKKADLEIKQNILVQDKK